MYISLKLNILFIIIHTHYFIKIINIINAEVLSESDNKFNVDGFDKDSLKKLTEFRQRHRKTVQGWLCAAAFVQNGTVYTDCTTHPAPNGQTGREWCYVEVQSISKGPRDWDFCADYIDYNVLRHKASQLFVTKQNDINYAISKLSRYENDLQSNINTFNNVCQTNNNDNERITTLESLLTTVKRQLSVFTNYKSYSKLMLQKSTELSSMVDLLRDDYISDARNCSAVIGYDVQPHSDGLTLEFYSNIFFQGEPITIPHHDSISIYWSNQLPVPVSFDEFSVIFKGYVEAPITGLYTFITESTLGSRLLLDDDLIINTFQSVHHQITDNNSSKPLQLIGGKRYKIEFKSFNYSPLRYFNPYEMSLSLSWAIDDHEPEIIPKEMFYSSPGGKLPRIFGLKGEDYGIGFMENGSYSFLDSNEHYLADISGKYIGMKFIKTKIRPQDTNVTFYTTMDIMVIVCLPKNTGFIPKGFDASGKSMGYFKPLRDTFSIYKSPDLCEPAIEQVEMSMYQLNYPAGKINLQVPKDTSFIIAISPFSHEFMCNGQIRRLGVRSCSSSSSESPNYDCMHAFAINTNELDSSDPKIRNDGWRSGSKLDNEEWLIINFERSVDLHTVHYHPLNKSQYMAKKIKFIIGNNEYTYGLEKGKWNFDIKPTRISSMKVVLSDFDRVGVVEEAPIPSFGGRMAFYGVECGQVTKEIPSLEVIFKGVHVPVIMPEHSIQDNGMPPSPLNVHNGFYFGWTNKAYPPSSCSNKVERRGGIQFGDNKWTLDVPVNGIYNVEIELGSLCKKHKSSLVVNDEVLQESIVLSSGEFLTLYFYASLNKTSRLTLSTLDSTTVIQKLKIGLAKIIVVYMGMESGVTETKYCNVSFRYYVPRDPVLKKQVMPHSGIKHIEDKIERDINDFIHKIENEDVVSLVIPRKENWDLKRDLTRKLSQLSYHTDAAILKLIRKGINDGTVPMATYTLSGQEADITGVRGQELLDEAARMADFDSDFE